MAQVFGHGKSDLFRQNVVFQAERCFDRADSMRITLQLPAFSFLFSCRIYQNIFPANGAIIFMLSQSKFFPIEQNFSCTTKRNHLPMIPQRGDNQI